MTSLEATAVVAGSFKPEHIRFIRQVIGWLSGQGVRVIAPNPDFGTISNPEDSFGLLDTDDPRLSPRHLEQAFMDRITEADALVLANHRYTGRLGLSAATEMAHARLVGTPVVSVNESGIRDHPDIHFSNDVTAPEQQALGRISYSGFLVWPATEPESWIRDKERARPMQPSHPDYPVLSGLRDRLLISLPDRPLQQVG